MRTWQVATFSVRGAEELGRKAVHSLQESTGTVVVLRIHTVHCVFLNTKEHVLHVYVTCIVAKETDLQDPNQCTF